MLRKQQGGGAGNCLFYVRRPCWEVRCCRGEFLRGGEVLQGRQGSWHREVLAAEAGRTGGVACWAVQLWEQLPQLQILGLLPYTVVYNPAYSTSSLCTEITGSKSSSRLPKAASTAAALYS